MFKYWIENLSDTTHALKQIGIGFWVLMLVFSLETTEKKKRKENLMTKKLHSGTSSKPVIRYMHCVLITKNLGINKISKNLLHVLIFGLSGCGMQAKCI